MTNFENILNNTSINEVDRTSIRFLCNFFKGECPPKLASRSFIFEGPPGIGKTFLAEKLLHHLGVEVLYCAQATFDLPNATKCKNLSQLTKEAMNSKHQILFIDDLNYLMNEDNFFHSPEDKRDFMAVLELAKRNPSKVLIVTCNGFYNIDETMIDRIEVKIHFDLPIEHNKKTFLKEHYKEYISAQQIDLLANNSIGYNFRDLPELLKLSYRIGNAKISNSALKQAMKCYNPTQMFGYEVQNGIANKLNNIIGNNSTVTALSRLVNLYHYPKKAENLGLRRSNLLLFHGPAGTGKSYTARCLAGELGYALIVIKASNLFASGDPYYNLHRVFDLAKRYRNCVVLIDEAEKLFGNASYGEDSALIGEFNRNIDGSTSREIRSLLVLAVNDLSRFGSAFHDRFVHLKFDLPTLNDRLEFCRHKSEDAQQNFNVNVDYSAVAKLSKDLSYRGLERLWNELFFRMMENKEVSYDAICEIAKVQRPDENENSIVG
ncbi:MAG: ATP-binding protein [Candidatus Woesearchaeota archaeon]